MTGKFVTLLLCRFLLTEGEPGWPGLGTALEVAEVVPEWTCDDFSTPEEASRGACCKKNKFSVLLYLLVPYAEFFPCCQVHNLRTHVYIH